MADNCSNCGTKFTFFGNSAKAAGGLCVKCDADRYQRAIIAEAERMRAEDPVVLLLDALEQELAAIIVSTETILPDLDIIARHGVVGSDVAFGGGPFKDLAVGLSNMFGGRSETMSKMMKDTRAVALDELKREAHALGANAVIGVAFTVTSISQNGQMTLMCATGTAVTVKPHG